MSRWCSLCCPNLAKSLQYLMKKSKCRFIGWFLFLKRLSFDLTEVIGIPSKCVGSMKKRLLINTVRPYALITTLVSVILINLVIIYRKSFFREGRAKQLQEKLLYRSLYVAIVIFYLVLPSISSSIFDAIKCRSFIDINCQHGTCIQD